MEENQMEERLRRSRLYGVSKNYPLVHKKIVDVGTLNNAENYNGDGDVKRKTREINKIEARFKHSIGTPPLDGICSVKGRHTSPVSTDIKFKSSSVPHKSEWRVGYQNNPSSYHLGTAGIDGLLEPSDSVREVLLQKGNLLHICEAYPLKLPSDIEKTLPPIEWKEPFNASALGKSSSSASLGDYTANSDTSGKIRSNSWRPSTTKPRIIEHSLQQDNSMKKLNVTQRFSLRAGAIQSKSPLQIDPHCLAKSKEHVRKLEKKNKILQKKLEAKIDENSRFSLPVESPTFKRSYLLGLDVSTESKTRFETAPREVCVTQSPQDELKTDQTKEKVRFRPRSTTALARMRPTSSSILIPVQFDPSANAKIAGAKRRAQSAASLAHFKSSTVYCFDIPAVNNKHDFKSVIELEREKRRLNREKLINALVQKACFHHLPLHQLFVQLKLEGLGSLRRDARILYDRFALQEYMHAVEKQRSENNLPSSDGERINTQNILYSLEKNNSATKFPLKEEGNADTDDPVTNRKLVLPNEPLWISRSQLCAALGIFNIPTVDRNLLFTATDHSVEDKVEVCHHYVQVKNLYLLTAYSGVRHYQYDCAYSARYYCDEE